MAPRKSVALWHELGIESIEQLREAAETDQVSKLKGFGKKTQESILESLAFAGQSKGKLLYPQAEKLADELARLLRDQPCTTAQVAVAGEVRRRLETVETVAPGSRHRPGPPKAPRAAERHAAGLTPDPRRSGPFAWRGTATESGTQVEVLLVQPEDFATEVFLNSAAEAHLSEQLTTSPTHQLTLRQLARREKFQQEEALYEKAGLQFIVPELREGLGEITPSPPSRSSRTCWKTATCAAPCTTTAPTPTATTASAKWLPGCATTATSTWACATTVRPLTTPTA